MYRLLAALVVFIVAVTGLVLVLSGNPLGGLLLGLAATYLMFSYTILTPDEIGVLLELGESIGDKDEGWYFTPIGIARIEKFPGTIIEDELPDQPEKIYRADGLVPPGMVPPIRTSFGQPRADDDDRLKEHPYNVAMVAESVPAMNWRITSATTFMEVFGSVANFRKICSDKAAALAQGEFADMTPARALRYLGKVSKKFKKMLVPTASMGSVEIVDAYFKPFVFSHELNESVVRTKIAGQNKKSTILDSEAEKQKRVNEATGTAEGIIALANARKTELIATGLAEVDADGDIVKLLPDATTKANTDAISALKEVRGTVVIGSNVTPVLNVPRGEEK